MNDVKARKLKLVRFGLMLIPPVAWALAFAPLYLVSKGAGLDWINLALFPSLVEAVIVGIICAVIYYAYKSLLNSKS